MEYVEIDAKNNVLTRRIEKFPKSKKPLILMFTTFFSVLLAVIVIPWVFLNSDNVDPLYKSGKVLWIKSDAPVYQNKIYSRIENEPRENSFVIDSPPPTVSGSLHVGHIFSYTHQDIIARFKRMNNFNVIYPMGWDDNGLPTEIKIKNKIVENSDELNANKSERPVITILIPIKNGILLNEVTK